MSLRCRVVGMASALWLVLMIGPAGAQLPSTDIYWVQFDSYGTDAKVDTVINLTHRAGYDNQPLMAHGGVYYSSNRDGIQNDIYKVSMMRDSTWLTGTRITETPESEYSPTLRPNFESYTVVRVEADSTQQLQELSIWGYPSERPLADIPGTDRIGYHAWLGDYRLLLFTLGKTNDLHLVDLKSRSNRLMATNVGRWFCSSVGWEKDIAYVQLTGDSAWLTVADLDRAEARRIIAMPAGVQDLAWISTGRSNFLIHAQGSELYRLFQDGSPARFWWGPWLNLEEWGLRGITRISGYQLAPGGRTGMLVVAADP